MKKVIYAWHYKHGNPPGLENAFKVGEADPSKKEYTCVRNDPLKVANSRITQYTKTAGVEYIIDYAEFHECSDDQVHSKLYERNENYGRIKRDNTGDEWTFAPLPEIKAAIIAAETGKYFGPDRVNSYPPRKGSQDVAISQAFDLYSKGHVKMLLNAKCRFGKTMTGYWIAKKLFPDGGKIFITTCMPSNTIKAWKEDCQSHIDFADFEFFDYHQENAIKRFEESAAKYKVLYCSLQTANKNNEDEFDASDYTIEYSLQEYIDSNKWDLCIIDESHSGSGSISNRKYIIDLDAKFKVFMTGTAASEIASGQFDPEEIYTWDYLDEQNLKKNWKNIYPDEPNPYETMPKMRMYKSALTDFFTEKLAFTLTDFFKTYEDKNGEYQFMQEKSVLEFLKKLCIDVNPFNKYLTSENKCGLWKIPYRAGSFAMINLFKKTPELSAKFDVIMLNSDNPPRVEDVRSFIKKSNKKVLMFTHIRFCTGVTISACDHVFIMTNGTTGNEYWQTVFRAGSPSKEHDHFNVYDLDCNRLYDQVLTEVDCIARNRKTLPCNKNKDHSYDAVFDDWMRCAPIFNHSQLFEHDMESHLAKMKTELLSYKPDPIQYKDELATRLAKVLTGVITIDDFYYDQSTKSFKKGGPKKPYNVGKIRQKKENGEELNSTEKKILSLAEQEEKKRKKEMIDQKKGFILTILNSLYYGYVYEGKLNIDSYLKSLSDIHFLPLEMYKYQKRDKTMSNDTETQTWINETVNIIKTDPFFKTQLETVFAQIEYRHDKENLLIGMIPDRIVDEKTKRYPTPQEVVSRMCDKIDIKSTQTVIDPCCVTGEFLKEMCNRGMSKITVYGICDNEKLAILSRFNVYEDWRNPVGLKHIRVGNPLTDNYNDSDYWR